MRLLAILLMFGIIAFAYLNYSSTPTEQTQSGKGVNTTSGFEGRPRNLLVALKYANQLATDHEKRRMAEEIGMREAMGDFSYSPGGENYVDEEVDVDSLTALEYVQRFVRSHCGPSIGFVLKCTVYNEGERGLSGVTVQVRTSRNNLDTVDYEGSGYGSYNIELEGSFPAGQSVTQTVAMPDKKTQWVSDRTTVIGAVW